MPEFDFLSTEDKPALLALSTMEWLSTAKMTMLDLGYKVHIADNHEDFQTRFSAVQYQVIVIEELFAANDPQENTTLINLQQMPMTLRRHATIILLGDSFQTMNALQAFQQSVHAVVNRAELSLVGQVIQKVVADNTLFLNVYHSTQRRLAEGAA